MIKLKIKKKTNPHKESIERRITDNETYLESLDAATEKYRNVQQVLVVDYEELRKMNQNKLNARDFLHILDIGIAAIAGIAVPLYGMNKAYRSEEVEGKLKNGTVFNLATKIMKNTKN